MTDFDPTRPLADRWRDAERRLYPLLLSQPAAYEHSVRLVRHIADELSSVGSVEELAQRFAEGDELVTRAAASVGARIGVVDADAIAGAAFALRLGELQAESRRASALERVAVARRTDETWTTLYESGVRTPEGDPIPPYFLLEACLVQPWGLYCAVTFDMDAGVPAYRIDVVRVELEGVRWWLEADPPLPARIHMDFASWQASLAQMREILLDTPIPPSKGPLATGPAN